MADNFKNLLNRAAETANQIWLYGWAEANAGNMSIRLDKSLLPVEKFLAGSKWNSIGHKFPAIAGDYFLVSATCSYLKNFKSSPQENLGVIQINPEGSQYRTIWGFENGGKPTSELLTHLYVHSARKKNSKCSDKVVLHVHSPNVITLSFILSLDSKKITQLLWQMHTESILAFPEGVGFVPFEVPGSLRLALKTAEVFKKYRSCIWQYHGIIAAGEDLDKTLGLIEIIEKVSGIYIKAVAAGGIRNKLSQKQLAEIAKLIPKAL